jgi:hypothetical protein
VAVPVAWSSVGLVFVSVMVAPLERPGMRW